jgi:glycosyltransferase involved in cell wall biosynthesis
MGMFRGGGEQFDLNIANGLQKLGCEVDFITSKPLFRQAKYLINEFETDYVSSPYLRDLSQKMSIGNPLFEYLPTQKLRSFSQKVYRHIAWRIFNFDFLIAQEIIFNYIKRHKKDYDIIQISGLPILACKIIGEFKIPTIVSFPGPPSIKYKKEIQKCGVVIASGDAVDIIRRNFRKDVYDIPPGIDCNLFKPVKNNIRKKYNISDTPLLLFVGRFVPLKNLPFLIKSFNEVVKENKRISLMLVGEGPLDKMVRHLVTKYKLEKKVIFTGRILPEQLPQYYSAADAFILTSSYESFSISTLEAMSCSLPIISTKVGWLPNLVTNGEGGFLVGNNDVEGLKNAILNLLGNKRLCKEMGKRNREVVEGKYSWVESAKKLKGIYEFLL